MTKNAILALFFVLLASCVAGCESVACRKCKTLLIADTSSYEAPGEIYRPAILMSSLRSATSFVVVALRDTQATEGGLAGFIVPTNKPMIRLPDVLRDGVFFASNGEAVWAIREISAHCGESDAVACQLPDWLARVEASSIKCAEGHIGPVSRLSVRAWPDVPVRVVSIGEGGGRAGFVVLPRKMGLRSPYFGAYYFRNDREMRDLIMRLSEGSGDALTFGFARCPDEMVWAFAGLPVMRPIRPGDTPLDEGHDTRRE